MFSPLEEHPKGHFVPFLPLEEHLKDHFITFSPLGGHFILFYPPSKKTPAPLVHQCLHGCFQCLASFVVQVTLVFGNKFQTLSTTKLYTVVLNYTKLYSS